jgi:hypothetical protein
MPSLSRICHREEAKCRWSTARVLCRLLEVQHGVVESLRDDFHLAKRIVGIHLKRRLWEPSFQALGRRVDNGADGMTH